MTKKREPSTTYVIDRHCFDLIDKLASLGIDARTELANADTLVVQHFPDGGDDGNGSQVTFGLINGRHRSGATVADILLLSGEVDDLVEWCVHPDYHAEFCTMRASVETAWAEWRRTHARAHLSVVPVDRHDDEPV